MLFVSNRYDSSLIIVGLIGLIARSKLFVKTSLASIEKNLTVTLFLSLFMLCYYLIR